LKKTKQNRKEKKKGTNEMNHHAAEEAELQQASKV